jgi:hypothetical protein
MAADGNGLITTKYLPEETVHCPLALGVSIFQSCQYEEICIFW